MQPNERRRRMLELLRKRLSLADYIDVIAADANIRSNIGFRGPNVYILFVAIIIASVGLNVNSIPVIIGAMLISPLMSPIIGFGLGLGTNDTKLLMESLKNLGVMFVISLVASTLYFLLTPLDSDNPTELLARTNPSVYDVLVAFFGGIAGILELSRKEKGTVLSGVAIATALMPPLCTVGYGIAHWNWQYAGGALYLFFINCVFIALATYLAVKYLHFPVVSAGEHRSRRRAVSYTLLIVILIVPSFFSAYNIARENSFNKQARSFVREMRSLGGTYIYDYSTDTNRKPYTLTLRLAGESLSSDQRAKLYSEGDKHGISATQIIVQEDATIEVRRLNETEVMRDWLASTEEQLRVRDDSIRILQAQVDSYAARELPSEQLAAELRSQWPAVHAVTAARGNTVQTSEATKETVVVVLRGSGELTTDELQRMENWLAVRLQTENVQVIWTQE